jgi:hypothetical protein
VIALVTAFLAAAWQAAHQAQTKAHLLIAASWTDLLTAAVIGAIGGLLLVRLGFFLFYLALYPLSYWKNKDWYAHLHIVDGAGGGIFFWELVCLATPPIDVRVSMVYMECLVIDPHGDEHWILDNLLSVSPDPTAVCGKLQSSISGKYSVRWYATYGERRLSEVTRRTFHVDAQYAVTLGGWLHRVLRRMPGGGWVLRWNV